MLGTEPKEEIETTKGPLHDLGRRAVQVYDGALELLLYVKEWLLGLLPHVYTTPLLVSLLHLYTAISARL
jgi:hypothetical protein